MLWKKLFLSLSLNKTVSNILKISVVHLYKKIILSACKIKMCVCESRYNTETVLHLRDHVNWCCEEKDFSVAKIIFAVIFKLRNENEIGKHVHVPSVEFNFHFYYSFMYAVVVLCNRWMYNNFM